MNTIEDFKNAPIGATATSRKGNIALKTERRTFEWFVYDSSGNCCDTLSSDEMGGYTLNPATPTTAREARALSWELAHSVKEGQVIPVGTWLVERRDNEIIVGKNTYFSITASEWDAENLRTLDPLPEPEPDWRDAPAVVALVRGRVGGRQVFSRENKTGTQWLRDTKVYRWDELIDVVPLYPKEDA